MSKRFNTLALIGALAVGTSASAQTFTDDFEADIDYLTLADFSGVIWDGLQVHDGTPAIDATDDGFPTVLNTTEADGQLTLKSVLTNWNQQGSDGVLLYMNVTGDFVAEVDVLSTPDVGFNESGLMARVDNGNIFDLSSSDNVQNRVVGWSGNDVQLRWVDDGGRFNGSASGDLGSGNDGDLLQTVRLRLERVGTLFTASYSLDGGTTYLSPGATDSIDRVDIPVDQPIQVGVMHAGYSAEERSAIMDNFSLTLGSILVLGDADGDGDVDDTDLGIAISNFTGPSGTGKTLADGDTDGDGDVDDTDLGVMISGFTGPLSPAAVPEPTSLALLGLGGLLAVRRRRA